MLETISTLQWHEVLLLNIVCFLFLMGLGYFLNGVIYSRTGFLVYGAVLVPLSIYLICIILYNL